MLYDCEWSDLQKNRREIYLHTLDSRETTGADLMEIWCSLGQTSPYFHQFSNDGIRHTAVECYFQVSSEI